MDGRATTPTQAAFNVTATIAPMDARATTLVQVTLTMAKITVPMDNRATMPAQPIPIVTATAMLSS